MMWVEENPIKKILVSETFTGLVWCFYTILHTIFPMVLKYTLLTYIFNALHFFCVKLSKYEETSFCVYFCRRGKQVCFSTLWPFHADILVSLVRFYPVISFRVSDFPLSGISRIWSCESISHSQAFYHHPVKIIFQLIC